LFEDSFYQTGFRPTCTLTSNLRNAFHNLEKEGRGREVGKFGAGYLIYPINPFEYDL
jgi:hypothetical protein